MTPASSEHGRTSLMLNELRLPTMGRLWAEFAERSDKESWPASRFLGALLEHELAERAKRRLERHRVESQLDATKTLASFEFTEVPMLSKAHVMALASGDSWLEKGANILIFGPPGVGKSHVGCGIGHALIDAGRRMLYMHTSELVLTKRSGTPLTFQHLTHLHCQCLQGERLPDQLHSSIQHTVVHDGVARVAGGEQHFEIRILAARLFGELSEPPAPT